MADPILIIFNAFEDLEEIVKAANTDFSKTQLVNKAAQIITNTNGFEIAMEEWQDKNAKDKKW